MVAIMSGADNGFFYAGQVMHFSSPFTVFLIYHKHIMTKSGGFLFFWICFAYKKKKTGRSEPPCLQVVVKMRDE